MPADLRQHGGTGVPPVSSCSHRRDARATTLSPPSSLFAVAALLCLAVAALASDGVDLSALHNFHRATSNVFSGAQPEGDAAFAALVKLGVKTILSVDGAKPDVVLAAKHGLRYVHLPIGYDGIANNRIAELAQAVATLPGPFFVHCHHGLHRGPAAVGILCRASAGWSANEAEQFMQRAGTAPEYAGLYRAVREFKPPTPGQLAAVGTNFPAVAKTSAVVDAMVAINSHYSRLDRIARANWRVADGEIPPEASRDALLLLEQFRELMRTDDAAQRPEDYRSNLEKAQSASEALHHRLKSGASPVVPFGLVRQSCTGCHRRYRNE